MKRHYKHSVMRSWRRDEDDRVLFSCDRPILPLNIISLSEPIPLLMKSHDMDCAIEMFNYS